MSVGAGPLNELFPFPVGGVPTAPQIVAAFLDGRIDLIDFLLRAERHPDELWVQEIDRVDRTAGHP